MSWLDAFRPKRTAAATTSTYNAAGESARALRRSYGGIPNKRQTNDGYSFAGLLTFLEDTFKGYDFDSRARVIAQFRKLAGSDEDVGGSLRDLQVLGNTEMSWKVTGGARAQKQALDELGTWGDRVYKGGLKQLADNQVREVYITGVSSIEWVPEANRSGVKLAEVVPAENIEIRREEDEWLYRQTWSPLDGYLHPVTYQYIPFDTDGGSPYGIPAMIPALATLARKAKLLDRQDRIVRALEKIAFVVAKLETPEAASLGVQSTADPEYSSRLEGYYNAMADVIAAASEAGFAAVPEGVEVTATNTTTNVNGLEKLMDGNQRLVWSSLGSPPFMRGDMSANYALAKVIYPILLAFANNIIEPVHMNLEHGANLHLRLHGIPASVKIERADPPNPFFLEYAQADEVQAKADETLFKLIGDAHIPALARRLGVDEQAIRDARAAMRQPPKEGEDDVAE